MRDGDCGKRGISERSEGHLPAESAATTREGLRGISATRGIVGTRISAAKTDYLTRTRRMDDDGEIHLNEGPHLWAYQSGSPRLGEPICPHLESEQAMEATRWHISDLGEFQSRIMNPNYEG